MKTVAFIVMLGFAVLLSGCSSVEPVEKKEAVHSSPETVLVTYHVKPGQEAEMKQVLAEAWQIYRHEKLVLAAPHVIVQGAEKGGARLSEIFTWVSHDAPDHAPASVKAAWGRMQALCEARDGHEGLEGGEVELVVPSAK